MASNHTLDWLREQTSHWVGERRKKLDALLDDIETSTVNAWYSARLLKMVYDDMDTCTGECGADYEFKDLSTETVEALRALQFVATLEANTPASKVNPPGSVDTSQVVDALRELHRVCLETDVERPEACGVSPGEYDAAIAAAERVLAAFGDEQ